MLRRKPKRYTLNRNRAGLAFTAFWAASFGAASCSAPGHREPAKSADPLATAIATEMNGYTYDDNIRAIIVQIDGRTRFEHYYASSANQSRSIFSVTKSVMSTLVGIAIGEGRLRLDERLDEMLPRQAPKMSARVAGVTCSRRFSFRRPVSQY